MIEAIMETSLAYMSLAYPSRSCTTVDMASGTMT